MNDIRSLIRMCLPSALGVALTVSLAACGGGGAAATSADTPSQALSVAQPGAADRVAVGDKLFNDTALSAGGRQACASCHVKARGHADAEGGFLPLGGPDLDRQGLRSTPSLHYLNSNTAFQFNAGGDPRGGFTWDGRADTRALQALGPLLAANEMAQPDTAAVVRTVRALSYYSELAFAYSLPANASDTQVLLATQQALQAYQEGDADYQPYSSKFDAVQRGQASFTAQEQRGLNLFNDPQRGNCASCHSSTPAPGETLPVFTNFRYFALGVPRNASAATADPAFFDLGLCGPLRTDLAHRTDLCGMFKVPTLRNVALTAPYFHNGAVATLEEAVSFYATRDSDPGRWYPTANGVVQRFNDLPPAYRGNVTQQAPFGPPPRNGGPRLNPQDVQDIVSFLRTLTDGFTP
ncbi:MAG: cytochrome c peroxidase [Betaproteobacteria bacterium]